MDSKKPSPKTRPEDQNTQISNLLDEEERGGFGDKGNGLPEPTRYGDWDVKGRCSDF